MPLNGLYISRIRKIAPEAESAISTSVTSGLKNVFPRS